MVIQEMAEIERRLEEEKETSEDFNEKSSSGTFWTEQERLFN